MLANKVAFRLYRIIQLFQKEPFRYSLKEVQKDLHRHGIETSRQKIGRDFKALAKDFFIEIEYDRKNDHYEMVREGSELSDFLNYIELIRVTDFLSSSLPTDPKTLSSIQFDLPDLRGAEWIQILVKAIRSKQLVSFRHQSFYHPKANHFNSIEPLLLKEFQNRWYLVAYVPKYENVRTFGLDRIHDLRHENQSFQDRNIDAKDLFKNTIGLTYSVSEPRLVKIALTEKQWKYLKAQPLHPSQMQLKESHFGSHPNTAAYMLRTNFELNQELLKLGSAVIVIEPIDLAHAIKAELLKAYENYF